MDSYSMWFYRVHIYFHKPTYCNSVCDNRRFGVNCEKECHCKDENENCQNNSPKGRCNSGCAPHFTGPTCQGNVSIDIILNITNGDKHCNAAV